MRSSKLIADRFEIADLDSDLIGRGGMGNVYRGLDRQTGQMVAIKALRADLLASNPEMLERFIREGEALRQLNHPNIVAMLSAVQEDGRHYLVMEYVEGGSLRDLIDRQGPLPVRRILEICLDLADALTRAHRLDIIHRDLKPDNVFVAKDGTPRLTDFGVAHLAGSPSSTQPGMIIGTIEYISPEACRGEPLDGRADIWAFGVMIYEMLTGKRPFKGETITDVLLAILSEPAPDLDLDILGAPEALGDLLRRMLEKDRYQRIASVRLVGAEIEALLHERTGSKPGLDTPGRFNTPTPPMAKKGRSNLPAQAVPFVGRESELAEVARLLEAPDVRLLTILGPGGNGKTRLAIEAASA
ncbi:MAG: serine/threonine protein kinase, partial [Chloroflexota bacterium]